VDKPGEIRLALREPVTKPRRTVRGPLRPTILEETPPALALRRIVPELLPRDRGDLNRP
jgi:hypothetical protein